MTFAKACGSKQWEIWPNAIIAARLTLRGICGASAYNSKVKDSKL